MDAKKCDRCGTYYDENKKHKTTGRVHGGTISGFCTTAQSSYDKCFDLCDDCVGSLLNKFMKMEK